MTIYSYKDILEERELYRGIANALRADKAYKKESEAIEKSIEKMNINLKKAERIFYKSFTDSLAIPVTNNVRKWRTISTDGESATDFIIIPDKWTDLWGTENEYEAYEDIENFVFETVGYKSSYDFPTGQQITFYWSFKRTKAGIAIVHERGIDW